MLTFHLRCKVLGIYPVLVPVIVIILGVSSLKRCHLSLPSLPPSLLPPSLPPSLSLSLLSPPLSLSLSPLLSSFSLSLSLSRSLSLSLSLSFSLSLSVSLSLCVSLSLSLSLSLSPLSLCHQNCWYLHADLDAHSGQRRLSLRYHFHHIRADIRRSAGPSSSSRPSGWSASKQNRPSIDNKACDLSSYWVSSAKSSGSQLSLHSVFQHFLSSLIFRQNETAYFYHDVWTWN